MKTKYIFLIIIHNVTKYIFIISHSGLCKVFRKIKKGLVPLTQQNCYKGSKLT